MKDTLQSLVRHALTFLAGMGVTLQSVGLIGTEDVAAVNAAGLRLQDVLAGLVAMIVTRLLLRYGGKFFGFGQSAGMTLLTLCMGLGFSCFPLVSCTPSGAPAVPLRACYETNGIRACYGTDGVTVDFGSGK
jgi:hypothetical protein